MEVRVSPHRHSQSLSRDVPSTIRLPSAIRCVDKDDEKSTKNTKIGEEENIFCRRRRLRLASSRSPRLFGASQKSFFSSARKAARLCVRRRCDRVFFFCPRKRREREDFSNESSVQNPLKSLSPSNFSTLFPLLEKLDHICSRHNNKRLARRSKPTRRI